MLKKPNFYIYFSFFLLIFYFVFSWNTNSFSWLSFWTVNQNIKVSENYIKDFLIDDMAINSLLANLSVWKWTYSQKHFLAKWIDASQTTKNLLETKESQLLKWTSDTKVVLEAYINNIRNTVLDNQQILNNLRYEKSQFDQKRNFCDEQKKMWDTMFFNWLDQDNSELAIRWLETSLDNSPCYINNRVYSNVYENLIKKIDFYNSLLSRKQVILENNVDLILNNFELFENNQLEELAGLRNELRSFNIN